jgi:pentatricopeptide repeat protein
LSKGATLPPDFFNPSSDNCSVVGEPSRSHDDVSLPNQVSIGKEGSSDDGRICGSGDAIHRHSAAFTDVVAREKGIPSNSTSSNIISISRTEYNSTEESIVRTEDLSNLPSVADTMDISSTEKFPNTGSSSDMKAISSVDSASREDSIQKPEDLPSTPIEPLDPDVAEHIARKLCWLEGDAQAISNAWESQLATGSSIDGWIPTMHWLLTTHPDRAVLVAKNTLLRSKKPKFSAWAVWETMLRLTEMQFAPHPKYAIVEASGTINLYLEILNSRYFSVGIASKIRRGMYLILTRSDIPVVEQLYDVLQLHKRLLASSKWTLLHFAHFFARRGDFERALQMLQEAVDLGIQVISTPFLSTCNRILRSVMLDPKHYHSGISVLSQLVGTGLEINLHIYTTLIRNALEAGDLETAIKIFDHLEKHDVEPNHFTYAILLQGLRECRDSDAVERVISKALRCDLDAWAATELVLCFYCLLDRNNTANIYNSVCNMYLDYFDPSPLRELGILSGSVFSRSSKVPLKPPRELIGIMLTVFLKHHGTEENVLEIYDRFRRGLLNGTSLLELAIEDHTYNAFIHTASQWQGTVRLCSEILRHMSHTEKAIMDPKTGEIVPHALPTVQSWSILVHAFARHNQPDAAEKVVELMEERGLKPDVVTWTSLLKAHAEAQDIHSIAVTLKRQEVSGSASSERSWTAFRGFKDREALLGLLRNQGQELDKTDSRAGNYFEGDEGEVELEPEEMQTFLQDDEQELSSDERVSYKRGEDFPAFEHEIWMPPVPKP